MNNFLKLGEIQLEFVKIYPSIYIGEETEKLIIEKILSFKAIKESDININTFNNKMAEEIHGENTSLIKLNVSYYNDNYDAWALNKLLKKFKNLNDLDLYISSLGDKKNKIDIRENTDYKIDKIRVCPVEQKIF